MLLLAQPCDGGAQVGFARVPELDDQRMPFERLLDDPPLHALAAPVDEAHLAQARLVGGVHVLFDEGLDVAGSKGVEIERRLDRHAVGHAG